MALLRFSHLSSDHYSMFSMVSYLGNHGEEMKRHEIRPMKYKLFILRGGGFNTDL